MHRALLSSYLCVTVGLLIGLYLAWSVVRTEPAIIGWALCLGGGLATGAWVAAVAGGVPLAGGSSAARPRPHIPLDEFDFDEATRLDAPERGERDGRARR